MTRLLYLASLREGIGMAAEEVALPAGVDSVAALVDWLRERGAPWAGQLAAGRRWRVAVNHELAQPQTPVGANDEVAFFPPVTGG